MPTIVEAIKSRSSKRAYLPKKVSKEIQKKILDAAAMTPSGANMQPWSLYAVSNTYVLKNIGDSIIKKMDAGVEHDQFIQYYPINWINPYKKRRIITGAGLYELMGVQRDDMAKRVTMWHDNFRWFGASTVFFIFTDRANLDGAEGVLLDCGAYMQSILLASREFGLDTCPQASTTAYGKVIADILKVPDNLALLYSVVIGYADPDAKINSYQPQRVALEKSVTFIE